MDNFMMSFTDIGYAFPDLLFIILLRAALEGQDFPVIGDPVVQLIIAISFVGWVTVARLVRGQMLSIAERDFVLAAARHGRAAIGVSCSRTCSPTLSVRYIVRVVFGIPLAIFAEASSGYIGLRVPPPTASLGRLLPTATLHGDKVWLVIIPAVRDRTAHALLHLPRRRHAGRP